MLANRFSHLCHAQQADSGPIDAPKTVAEVKQEPYGLPDRYLAAWTGSMLCAQQPVP